VRARGEHDCYTDDEGEDLQLLEPPAVLRQALPVVRASSDGADDVVRRLAPCRDGDGDAVEELAGNAEGTARTALLQALDRTVGTLADHLAATHKCISHDSTIKSTNTYYPEIQDNTDL